MNVDFLHDQIIRDTVTPAFIASFNENLLPLLMEKYGESLECVQFYENHIADGFRIGGVFYYPLTVVISGNAKTEWISWQVANYRIYDNFNPFSYKGKDSLAFSLADNVPIEAAEKMIGRPIYSPGNTLPIILSAATDDKTFLAGKYSQGFIDLMSAELTELIEREMVIAGLAGSGVVIEMNFAPGTYMEHITENTTYRRLKIKARACAARDFWVKWTRLDGNGTYTISDNVSRGEISFELGEDVSGKIKEKEYRYLTAESIEKYQQSMSRKNLTEWRDMMRRVIRRGEVEKLEVIEISAPPVKEEPILEIEKPAIPEEPAMAEVSTSIPMAETDRKVDDITERLNALLGKSDVEFSREPEALAESINADLGELLKNALGITSEPIPEVANAEEPESEEVIENTEEAEDSAEEEEKTEQEPEVMDLERALALLEKEANGELEADEESEEEKEGQTPSEPSLEETVEQVAEEPEAEEAPVAPVVDESAIEARIRRELEEKMRAEMDELRRKNEEAEALRAKVEAQKRAEAREKELLAEAARQAILDSERREAEKKAEAERRAEAERIEAERRAEAERIAAAEEAKREAARAEQEKIEAELKARLERDKVEQPPVQPKKVLLTKSVNLVFRRPVVDKAMTKRVHEIIVATIKYLGKENVYMRIKATVPDPATLNLTFSEIPANEQQLIVDIIQVLGKSNLGIIKAILE